MNRRRNTSLTIYKSLTAKTVDRHHRSISRERIAEIIDLVRRTPMDERDKIVGLEPKRKDIAVCSGVWLLCIMDYLGAKEIVNSETSNTEGYLKYRLSSK